jgi:hypothetical protein
MFWKAGGIYLVALQAAACATFGWARWFKPDLGDGSGFWIAGAGTIFLGLCVLAFETVGLFWSGEPAPLRRVGHVVLGIAFAATAAWGLGPFGQAAFLRLATTGNL